jgi:hypothetical protein
MVLCPDVVRRHTPAVLRLPLIGGVLLALTLAASASAVSQTDYSHFLNPDRNIACYHDRGTSRVSCLAYGKHRTVMTSYHSGALASRGKAVDLFSGFNSAAIKGWPVLPYSLTWRAGPIACKSLQTGVICSNGSGSGFLINEKGDVHTF